MALSDSLIFTLVLVMTACGWEKPLDSSARVATTKQLQVFHLGHSLVGRDIPAMPEQLAGVVHDDHGSQLGWAVTSKSHSEPIVPISGFEQENARVYWQDAMMTVQSGRIAASVEPIRWSRREPSFGAGLSLHTGSGLEGGGEKHPKAEFAHSMSRPR